MDVMLSCPNFLKTLHRLSEIPSSFLGDVFSPGQFGFCRFSAFVSIPVNEGEVGRALQSAGASQQLSDEKGWVLSGSGWAGYMKCVQVGTGWWVRHTLSPLS